MLTPQDILTQEDKQAIDTCTTRPNSVWAVIKEIAIKKYDEYLAALEPTCNTPARQSEFKSIAGRWKTVRDDLSEKENFLSSEEFDSDLRYVLKAVAQRLHGLSTKFMNLEPYIRNWHNNRIMDRRIAFIVSIGFGFNIEETRKLLYNVLDDAEQMDFNPRLPNEMIYAYAIINGISLTVKPKKIDGEEVQQPSVENMLYKAKLLFLEQLFGRENVDYFPELIKIADSSFNILDSVNMTKTAFLLAAIKTSVDVNTLMENTDDKMEGEASQSEENAVQTGRRPKLFPDDSVMQRCYEYVSYDQEDKFCNERVAKPTFEKAQISKVSCLRVLKYVFFILETAPNLVDHNSKGSDQRIAIYSDMKDFIEKCIELVKNQSEKSMFSVVDFLEIWGESSLGGYTQSEFTAMIDNIIIDTLDDDWRNPRYEKENGRVSSYHSDSPKVNGDQAKYFRFFFSAVKVAFRDLRAITVRDCTELWPTYVEMNKILAFPYFSDDGVGMKVWENNEELIEYRYTVDILEDYREYAENMPDPYKFISGLLSDFHCFEYFNHAIISRGKEKFVADLDDEGKLIGRTHNAEAGRTSLFVLQEDNTFTQDENLEIFYPYTRFQRQYYAKTIVFSRKDILKLAFWGFLGSRQNYNPKLGPDDFTDYFDTNVTRDTCCAVINESNSLDRFLLLCLEHEDPIQFLRGAIAYQKTLPKKKSENFWKILK